MLKASPFLTLKTQQDFLKVKNSGKSWVSESFILQGLLYMPIEGEVPSKLSNIQIGFIASKKLGKAVARNKAKRRMREICRLSIDHFNDRPADYILIARPSLLTHPFAQLLNEFAWALKHLSRLLEPVSGQDKMNKPF